MKVFKYIDDGKLYFLIDVNGSKTAMPVNHDSKPINNCDVSKFIPLENKPFNNRI